MYAYCVVTTHLALSLSRSFFSAFVLNTTRLWECLAALHRSPIHGSGYCCCYYWDHHRTEWLIQPSAFNNSMRFQYTERLVYEVYMRAFSMASPYVAGWTIICTVQWGVAVCDACMCAVKVCMDSLLRVAFVRVILIKNAYLRHIEGCFRTHLPVPRLMVLWCLHFIHISLSHFTL